MALHVQAILQTQNTEFIFRQFIVDTAAYLIAKLCHTFLDDLVVVLVVTIHLDVLELFLIGFK
jgi:hypothetical protein